MKNRILWIVALTLLALLGGYYLYSTSQTDYLEYERHFAVDRYKDIHTIFVANRPNGKHYVLQRQEDGHWTVNGRRANNTIVKGMLAALHSLTIQYKPSRAAYVNVMHNIASYALKIEAYDDRGHLMKTLYLGGTPPDSYGTYAIVAGSDQPFVIHKKLEEGDVRAVFDLSEDDLRDPFLFPFDLPDIREVKVDYPLIPNASFHIEGDGKHWSLAPSEAVSVHATGQPNQSLLTDYLYEFGKVECEGFINSNPVRDTLPSVIPYAVVEVRTKDTSVVIQTYPWDQELEKIRVTGELSQASNIFHYICLTNHDDLVLVQTPLIEKIFRRYEDFLVPAK